jgi:hypothetical protein
MSGAGADKSGRHPRLEPLLARTLAVGTWLASAIILLGLGAVLGLRMSGGLPG